VERSNLALAASAAASPTFGVERAFEVMPEPIPVHVPAAGEPVLTASAGAAVVVESPAALTAALARPEVLDTLLDAMAARQERREAERRAEVERLSASFAAV
jgi:hypothetical protein